MGKAVERSTVMFNGQFHTVSSTVFPILAELTKGNPRISLSLDPGFCNTNLRIVHVAIDTALPENQNLKPDLEENEFIEVFTVPLAGLWEECKKLEAAGYAIDARVGTLAEGIQLAKRFKLT